MTGVASDSNDEISGVLPTVTPPPHPTTPPTPRTVFWSPDPYCTSVPTPPPGSGTSAKSTSLSLPHPLALRHAARCAAPAASGT